MRHNLPGTLRAYGDRALFRRFRMRLTRAPLVFAASCLLFAFRGCVVVLLDDQIEPGLGRMR